MKIKFLMTMVVLALLGSSTFVPSGSSSLAWADPCGMVPPIYTGGGSPITRIGLQQTYVFHKDGIESFVIRPGFEGKVDNFGMLIPFPNPPALRKVPDNVFQQIASGVEPPEVVIDCRPRVMKAMQMDQSGGMAAGRKLRFADKKKSKNSIRVLKQEAVGMYEVAVLEAGSADALKRWMKRNKFQYPKGMDKVTNEYVKIGWCFVAVKTKVAQNGEVQPKPGQRKVKPDLPAGSVFDGTVQGMGFRFKSEKLVVPMRLSAFNEGDMRNVVYILTDGPSKIRNIPEEYVVRQVPGKQLVENVTMPLPLRLIGGTMKDIPEWRKKNLDRDRNPEPHNGIAKRLFASDLAAMDTPTLSLEHEETEKELLSIGEHFGLRGKEIDDANALAIKKEAESGVAEMMPELEKMTLTVVDGDFPREVVANENLNFDRYVMAPMKNRRQNYDPKVNGSPSPTNGRRFSAYSYEKNEIEMGTEMMHASSEPVPSGLNWLLGMGGLFFLLTLTGTVLVRRDGIYFGSEK